MIISHTGNYRTVIDLARKHNATEVSIQHHIFVNFNLQKDAEEFCSSIRQTDLKLFWNDINTKRPGISFEVIITRF